MRPHVLILAGTAEARALAGRLAEIAELRVTASLAGVTAAPEPIAAATRTGGFGGAEGLAAWLRAEAVAAVIDATHPFAARMAANAAAACAATGVPRLRLLRPPWEPAGDWRPVAGLAEAAAALPAGAHALITTGRKELGPLLARPDVRFLLRVIEPVPGLPAHIEELTARPPFALMDEIALMQGRAVTHLVAKNSGGAGRAKLDAAARLGLPVLIVERPAPPPGPQAATVGQAVVWALKTVGNGRRAIRSER